MDPNNRHHDSTYLARNNDERTRASATTYLSRGTPETTRNGTGTPGTASSFDDVRSPHLQYYTSNRDLLAKKPAVYGCTCNVTNPLCNTCRATAVAAAATSTTTTTAREDNWTSARQSPIYINTNQHHLQHNNNNNNNNNNHHHISNNNNNNNINNNNNSSNNSNINNNNNSSSRRAASYWPPEEQHALHKEQLTATTYLQDARKPPTLTESNFNYKSVGPQQQQHHHHQQQPTTTTTSSSAINHFASREQQQQQQLRYYNEIKYAIPSLVVAAASQNLKIGNYSSSTSATAAAGSSASYYDKPTTTTNVHSSQYPSGTPPIDHHHQQRLVRSDHIVNPSNTLGSKEQQQQPSPNYGRKCPQIYGAAPPEREQHATSHKSLYMETPQFSSDKFQTIAQSAIQKYTSASSTPPAILPSSSQSQQPIDAALEYRRSVGGSSSHILPEHITSSSSSSPSLSSKMRVDSPQPPIATSVIGGGGGAPTVYKTTSSHKYTDPQRLLYNSNATQPPSIGGTVNYYGQSNHHQPIASSSGLEVTPVIMKTTPQPTSHYVQYSNKSPLPQTAQYSSNTNSNESRRDKVNYMKLDNEPPVLVYEPHANNKSSNNNRGLYHNPYITPPKTENCCTTERASPYGSSAGSNSTVHSYRGESPHGYPTKYGKLVQETISMHKLNELTPTPPPPPSSAPAIQVKSSHVPRSQNVVSSATPSRSHSASNSYYYGTPSPAAGSSASPSPQMHHTVYTPTPPPPPLTSAAAAPPSSSNVANSTQPPQQAVYSHIQQQQQQQAPIILPQGYTPSGDIYTQPAAGLLPPKNFNGANSSLSSSSSSNNSIVGGGGGNKQSLQAAKKLQAPKPNYRELINELMMRNTASEEELNLQIIKKTLNVNTPPPPPPSTLRIAANQHTAALVVTPPTNHHHHTPPSVIHQPLPPSLAPNINHAAISTTAASSTSIVVPHIKQEIVDKPPAATAAHSPLDLSMRTVKTKADSTEYKYRHTSSVDYKHGLPRFDITPNFSAASVAQRLSTASSSSSNNSTNRHEQQNYTAPVREPTSSKQAAYRIQQVSPQPGVVQQAPTSSLVIKTAPRQHEVALAQCARPSVLVEPNPYAKVVVAPPPPAQPSHQVLACEQLPPDTSIVVLPKLVANSNQQSNSGVVPEHHHQHHNNLNHHQPLRSIQLTQSAYSSSSNNNSSSSSSINSNNTDNFSTLNNNVVIFNEQKNPNYFGQKRHLQEYSNANNKYHNHNNNNTQEPYIKKQRMDLPASHDITTTKVLESNPPSLPRAAEIPVIAINEQALELERRRANEKMSQAVANSHRETMPTSLSLSSSPSINTNNLLVSTPICKQEPLTPTLDNNMPGGGSLLPSPSSVLPSTTASVPIKAERIRTKAELKGFTFNPPPVIVDSSTKSNNNNNTNNNNNNNNNNKVIKTELEPVPVPVVEEPTILPSIPGLNDEFNESNLLDFDWSNACNSFVEQLRSSSCSRKSITATAAATTTTTTIDGITVIQKVPPDIVKQEISEDDLPVAHIVHRKFNNNNNNSESAEKLTPTATDAATAIVSTTTTTGGGSGNLQQKKLSRLDREKKRLVQEQRIAARLPDGTSSESDNELDKRKSERQKKPIRKGKTRKQMLLEKASTNDDDDDDNEDDDVKPTIVGKAAPILTSSESSSAETKSFKSHQTNRKRAMKRMRIEDDDDDENENTDTTTTVADSTKKQASSSIPSSQKLKCEEKSKKSETTTAGASSASASHGAKTVKSNKVQYSTANNKTNSTCKLSSVEEDEEDEDEERKQPSSLSSSAKSTLSSKKKKLQAKIALNTMTRSKRKKELEMQLANSKVLRNDKIIRNSTTKIKRKYVRKLVAAKEAAASKDANIVGTRLRARQVKEMPMNGRKMKRKENKEEGDSGGGGGIKKVSGEQNLKGTTTTTTNGKSSKTQQQDLYLELYRFKRALKIPPKLITFENMNHHKIAASLPDLERGNAMEELKCFKNSGKRKSKMLKTAEEDTKLNKGVSKKPQIKEDPEPQPQPKSIIDLLHSRVTNSGNANGGGGCVTTPSKPPSVVHNFSETSQNTESTSVYELPLPTPIKKQDDDSDAKRHFSIFDTKVLQTKTRTESKLQQRREIIREIFVGSDRPASAPPDVPQADDIDGDAFMNYKKCEQFLEQMNIMLTQKESKFSRIGIGSARFLSTTTTSLVPKKEEEHDDLESTSVIDPDEKHHACINSNSTSVGGHLHRRRGKYIRRKGSSGFDYIRKKKKPATNSTQQHSSHHAGGGGTNANGQHQQHHHQQHHNHHWLSTQVKNEKPDEETEKNKTKTEDDVCREIQKWVLNKGVGQSTMHKAARQGYIDVVVYCLDRMGMNPNQKDNAGYTPLHEACTHGWLEIARILLEFGANHSEAAQAGIRPLHGAIENDHEEVVRLLLSYGADPLLATYSGQTPLMLASSRLMRSILNTHLSDAQSEACNIRPIKFPGPWEIFDRTEYGYDIFDDVPDIACDKSRALRRKGNDHEDNFKGKDGKNQAATINGFLDKKSFTETSSVTTAATTTTTISGSSNSSNHCSSNGENVTKTVTMAMMTTSKLDNGTGTVAISNNNNNNLSNGNLVADEKHYLHCNHQNHNDSHDNDNGGKEDGNYDEHEEDEEEINKKKDNDKFKENSDSFEFEEADVLLPPLYLLKDEGSEKWVLLNDLCNLLKVKSKDTLLNKICPGSTTSTMASAHKNLIREYKLSDFLEKATCLQLLCAGEKLNIGASKVVLIKYNESVKNLLGVNTILMQF